MEDENTTDFAMRPSDGNKRRLQRLMRKKERLEQIIASKEASSASPEVEEEVVEEVATDIPEPAMDEPAMDEPAMDEPEVPTDMPVEAAEVEDEVEQIDPSLTGRAANRDRAASIAAMTSRADYVDNLKPVMNPDVESSWVGQGGYRFRYIPDNTIPGNPPKIEVSGGLSGKIAPGETREYGFDDPIFKDIMKKRLQGRQFDPLSPTGVKVSTEAQGEMQDMDNAGGAPVAEPQPPAPEGMADQETGPASVDVASDADEGMSEMREGEGAVDTSDSEIRDRQLEQAVSSDPRIAPIFDTVNRMQQEINDLAEQRTQIIDELNALPANIVGQERTDAIEAGNTAIAKLATEIERKRKAGLALVDAMNSMREGVTRQAEQDFQ